MPLHPVPIIIGTTLAVIGSGYAFKKFVYDPHVAPFIEALIAAHQHSSHESRQRIPVPVPSSPSYAATTARRDRATELRRRRRSSALSEREGLLGPRNGYDQQDSDAVTGGRWSYDRGEFTAPPRSPHGMPATHPHRPPPPPLVDLTDTPASAGTEMQSLILTRPMTPIQSGWATPASPIAQPFHSRRPSADIAAPDSTTFSLLSLSRPSSPERYQSGLGSMTFGTTADQWADVRMSTRRVGEEDVLSLPETSTSGYEDAEAYSTASGGFRSPVKIHSELARTGAISPIPVPAGAALGLNTLLEQGESSTGRTVQLDIPRRGPMSVVSLSESEGWGGESDWDARSQGEL